MGIRLEVSIMKELRTVNMKIIITENQELRLRRVLHIIEDYISELSPKDICAYWQEDDGISYAHHCVRDMAEEVMGHYRNMNYDQTYDLIKEWYWDQLNDFFNYSLSNCDKD